jgi:hypothetical protein
MPGYIEEFLDNAFVLLLNNKGYEFIQYYYSYIEKIYNKKIPLSKIATKSKIKKTIKQYETRGLGKNGQLLPSQAHMELAIKNGLQVSLGDTIYYINNGTKKTDGDIKKIKPLKKGYREEDVKYYEETFGVTPDTEKINSFTKINCYLLNANDIEKNPDALGDYNVEKYITMFNKRVESLLIVFDDSVRFSRTTKEVKKKNKETGEIEISTKEVLKPNMLITNPDDKKSWLLSELELVSGQPFKESDQDTLDELFTPSEKEMAYWKKFNYNPDFWFNDNVIFTLPGLEIEVPV